MLQKVGNTGSHRYSTNDGSFQNKDMTVQNGGSSINTGYEKGEWLKIEDNGGKHANSGFYLEPTWWSVDGELNNEKDGRLDATEVREHWKSWYSPTNDGTANYDDKDYQRRWPLRIIKGYEKGDNIKTVESPTVLHESSGTSIWNEIKVDGGDFGKIQVRHDTGKLTIDDGKVEIVAGELNAKDIPI